MQPDVVFAAAGHVQAGAGQHGDSVPNRRLRERSAIAVRQPDPQGLTAANRRRLPIGQVTGQFSLQMVVTALKFLGPPRRKFVETPDQLGGRKLTWRVTANIMHGP